MKLLVGLGNLGRKYENTRHNIGFEVLVAACKKYAVGEMPQKKFDGEILTANVSGEKVLMLFPHTFMNASGRSVLAARDFFKIANEDILVVCDDMNLPLGKLRFRAKGSDGGQKGLADIIRRLGTNEIARLRVGIDRPPEGWDAAGYVLGKFTAKEREEVDHAVATSVVSIGDWVQQGIQYCMNQYN